MGYQIQSGALSDQRQSLGGDKQKVIVDKSTISLEDIPVNLVYMPEVVDPPNAEDVRHNI